MDLTDLLSELTKPLLPTKALVISFLVFLGLCIVAIIAEKLNFTNVAGVCAGLSIAMAVVTVVITVSQPSKTKLDYDLSRDKNYVYYEVMWKESTHKSLEDIHTFIQMRME